jgi:predicted acylesterase/phospholipase RssA
MLGAGPAALVGDVPPDRVSAALVLSGGGARGAYEAGVIEGLVEQTRTPNGTALPPYDVICGTSIGTLIGWFVATGQYTKLRALWGTIAGDRIFRVKRKYRAVLDESSGVATRIYEVVRLARGLVTTERGILDGDVLERWIDEHVDPRMPVLVPFVFTATNVENQRGEYFYRLPFLPTAVERDAAVARLRATIAPNVAIRPATDELLRPAIRASAALPILFDPVKLPSADGKPNEYLDGGIADNTPIDAARGLAKTVYAVLVDPAVEPPVDPKNAFGIGVEAFGIAQKRYFDASLRAAYLETRGKRLAPASTSVADRAFLNSIFDVDLYVHRPATTLAVGIGDFNDQAKIDAAYDLGRTDALAGWKTFVPTL